MMTPADVLEESFIANARRNAELADYMTMIQLATIGSMGKEGQQEFGKALKQLRGKD